MANSPTKTIRIKPGSALERLTADAEDFTARVHHMADVLELAMEEEAKRAQDVSVYVDNQGKVTQQKGNGQLVDYSEHDPEADDELLQALDETDAPGPQPYTYKASTPLSPVSWEHHSVDKDDEAQVLAAAREQYPAGLEPVGVLHPGQDDLDDEDVVQPEEEAEHELPEDLSDLI